MIARIFDISGLLILGILALAGFFIPVIMAPSMENPAFGAELRRPYRRLSAG